MDFMETALYRVAQAGPIGIKICHDAAITWLQLANIISLDEALSIHRKTQRLGLHNTQADQFLVQVTDPALTRLQLQGLTPGNVVGFYVGDTLGHSMVKLDGDTLAGVNNITISAGQVTQQYTYNQLDLDDIYNQGGGFKSGAYRGGTVHYQHPGVLANRIVRYINA